jgi:hypothetical protein
LSERNSCASSSPDTTTIITPAPAPSENRTKAKPAYSRPIRNIVMSIRV